MGQRQNLQNGPVQVKINDYATQWLRKGFDWVYPKEIKGRLNCKPGTVVHLLGSNGHFLGVGIFEGDPIAIRRFREDKGPLDQAFFETRLQDALNRRPQFNARSAWRWVHAENDDLPGIRLDVWGEQLSLTLYSSAFKPHLTSLLGAISSLKPNTTIWGHIREEKIVPLGPLVGDADPSGLWVEEDGLRYWVEPSRSPDAGLFSDMRDLRKWLTSRVAGKDLLNLFCFTGAFSVSAAHHGANEVVSVDLSKTYMDWTKRNFKENNLIEPDDNFSVFDSMKALDRFRRKGRLFDIVIADPPSFSHSEHGTWSVERGLSALTASCLRILKPGGLLVLATNHGKMSPKDFSKHVRDAGFKTNRRLRIIHQYSPPCDFPAAISFPESRYLKCWVVSA